MVEHHPVVLVGVGETAQLRHQPVPQVQVGDGLEVRGHDAQRNRTPDVAPRTWHP